MAVIQAETEERVIECRNLCCGYPGRRVLTDITLSFEPGNVTVLLGPNGCGKSTLFRTIIGLQKRTGGEILLDGISFDSLTGNEIARKVSYLAQSRNVPNITARRMVLHGRFPYLSYPRRYRKEDYDMVEKALTLADAADLSDRLVTELSGGQRQKIYLAMALAQDTETILMDEPTTFLDVSHQLDVMRIARRLANEGKAVVLVLHDLCLSLRTADRVAVFCDGELKRIGTPEEIYAGGVIDQVFGIRLHRMDTKSGPQYFII